jgi:hypothetical protein
MYSYCCVFNIPQPFPSNLDDTHTDFICIYCQKVAPEVATIHNDGHLMYNLLAINTSIHNVKKTNTLIM